MAAIRMPSAPRTLPGTKEFFGCIGLNMGEIDDRVLYKKMRNEVVRGYERICYDPDSLLPHFKSDSSVKRPFCIVQITEAALHRESVRIYEEGEADTRSIYEIGMGDYEATSDRESWIIRYMLWQMFENEGDEQEADEAMYYDPARETWAMKSGAAAK